MNTTTSQVSGELTVAQLRACDATIAREIEQVERASKAIVQESQRLRLLAEGIKAALDLGALNAEQARAKVQQLRRSSAGLRAAQLEVGARAVKANLGLDQALSRRACELPGCSCRGTGAQP